MVPHSLRPAPPHAAPSGSAARWQPHRVAVPAAVLAELDGICPVDGRDGVPGDDHRDWWPLGIVWGHQGIVMPGPDVVARPAEVAQVAEVLALCDRHRLPVTTVAGRSGVVGGAVAIHGGVALDMTGLAGIVAVAPDDLLVDVAAGTFGDTFEAELRVDHGLTVGHWPQSMSLSTVGGWLACRGAGQYSTRYGKIEDIVNGLDVVLANGHTITTGGSPRAAVGPDLTQLFVGCEGTLGVITGARLRARPVPAAEARDSWSFRSFADGLDACRRILRRGATPAVLRLYDRDESLRSFDHDGHLLLILDEADTAIVEATMRIVESECRTTATDRIGPAPVVRWLSHRNDVSALERLVGQGLVVDTMEIAAHWSRLPDLYEGVRAAMSAVAGTVVASCHESHAYPDGACLYFTFAGAPEPERAERYYVDVWDAGTRATLAAGGSLSHHHGIGLNRARFMPGALGPSFDVLVGLKTALDPNGILNPGKLGLPDAFGDPGWP